MKILVEQQTKDAILALLKKVDSYFIPFPLSHRVNLRLYSKKLAKYAVHFSVIEDNQLIGMCCCYMNDPKNEKAFISITCVDPYYFGMGLGKKLTFECEAYAKRYNYKYIEFEVHIENTPSIEMHKTIGYTICKQEAESFYMRKLI